MGKYLESLGTWEHTICGITHKIEPTMMDNDKVIKIMDQYAKDKSQANMLRHLTDYYYQLVLKVDPTLSEQDKSELALWVKMNQMKIMEDIMVSHRITTKEEMDKNRDKATKELKNSMGTA